MSVDKLKITRIRNVTLPTRANKGDAGIDLYIPFDLTRIDSNNMVAITGIDSRYDYDMNTGYLKRIFIGPNESVLIQSGLKVNVPDGYVLKIENKSGISAKKHLLVGAGIVDSSYEGEILVNLHNTSSKTIAVLNPGDKFCQAVLYKIETPAVEEVETVVELFKDKKSTREEGGFGSTGA